jgi:hypothetical protein
MTYKFYKAFLLFLMVSVMTLGAFAQNNNSTIKGTVTDAGGAVVSGATVTLTNVGTSQELSTTSGADGFYTFSNLSPANYKLAVSAPGFANWVGVLTLRVSQAALVDATLNAASVATQVTVKDVTPVIDAVNPTLSDVKNATAIETIPVQNRNILNVLAFSPGVVAGNYGGSGGGYTRVNGITGGSLDYLVDGQTMSNRFTNELQTNPQPTPTFQEVKIITASGDAQYGRPGLIELVTKSGTNQFHGQAYELNKNNHLQAKTYNSGPTIPFLQHNEWGAQLGGPVWIPKVYNGKDKTFFFVDFEWIQQNANAVEQYTLPTMTQRQGNLSDVFANTTGAPLTIYDPNTTAYDPTTGSYTRTAFQGNIIPANRLNPVTQKIFGITPVAGLAPLPEPNINNPTIWQYTPNYIPTSSAATIRNKLYTAKVDHVFGPNRLAARYTYTSEQSTNPEYYAPTEPDLAQSGGSNGALTFTTVIGPRMVNVARAGVQYNNQFSGPEPLPGVTTALGLPSYSNQIGWPSFYWNYGNTDNYWGEIDRDNPKQYPDQTITGSDQFSYNRGNHQLMFGFEVDNSRLTTSEVGQPGGGYHNDGLFSALQDPTQVANGTYDVNANDTGMGLADFLLGDMSGVQVNNYPNYHTRQTEYSGFAQDNWRVTQNLTLTLGLRYEYWTAFTDASGLYSTFDPSGSQNGIAGLVVYQGSGQPAQTPPSVLLGYQTAGLPIESAAAANYPLSLFTMPKNNWEPRIGFAYQLNNKTVLRGGWGIYQWVIPLQQFQQATRKNPPFYTSESLQPGEINGQATDEAAAELEFPIASANYGGPQPVNQFMLGSQNCTGQPAGTCNPPGLLLNSGAVQITQGGGFAIAPMSPNYKPSTVQEWNLTLARELPFHTGFQLSYIGNHSYNLLQQDPLNYTIPREECADPACTAAQRRAYPNFATSAANQMSYFVYNGYSNTNELQAQITHTWGNGLTLQSYFTWGRFLTTTEAGLLQTVGNPSTLVPAALTPGYNLAEPLTSGASTADRLRAIYSNDPTLPTKTFQLNAHYQFPFGKGQRFLGNAHGIVNALVSGYNISPFFLWHSGFYFSPYFTPYNSGAVGGTGGRGVNLAPGKTGILPEGQRTSQRWFDASVWDPTSGTPYAGQTYELNATQLQGDYRNNIPDDYMTGPGYNQLDANFYKLTPLWRNLVFDMEAQVFNVYNHQSLGIPGNTGIITVQPVGVPRTIQLQAKFIF